MESMMTKYGPIDGIVSADHYSDGSLKECIVGKPISLSTPYGVLVPQYRDDGVRRKYGKSLSFYPDGALKSVSLAEQISIRTSIGTFPAELITFYEDGAIKRLFPLNGKLSGYWSEAKEYSLAREFEFHFPFGSFKRKIISIHFYPDGAVKSLTFWPEDSVTIKSPLGMVAIRKGLALYPDGAVKSVEPFQPLLVPTPIGPISVYDKDAVGIHGDTNSLCFRPDGTVESVISSTDRVTVTDPIGNTIIFQPGFKPSLTNEGMMETVPLPIAFNGDRVRFQNNSSHEYEVDKHSFSIHPLLMMKGSYSGCGSCDLSG